MLIKLFSLLTAFSMTCSLYGQQKSMGPVDFTKLEVGPRIELVMVEGDQADIQLEFFGIHPDELHFKQSGKKVRMYLDKAKNWEKQKKIYTDYGHFKEAWYEDGYVVAYITYKELSKLVIKGDQDVDLKGSITDDIFKLKVYGDLDIEIDEIRAERMKVKMYGDCSLSFDSGSVAKQKYVLFGEHDIDASAITGELAKLTNFGDSHLDLNPERVKMTAFGETDLVVGRGTDVRKGLVIGETDISPK